MSMGEGALRGRDAARGAVEGTGEAERASLTRLLGYGRRGVGVAGSRGTPLGGVGARSMRIKVDCCGACLMP